VSDSKIKVFDFTADAYLPKVPAPFLVDGALHRSQTITYGQTGSGKSMLATSLAVAVASGQSQWNGLPVTKGGPVAYISGDPDEYETYERLDRVRSDMGSGRIKIVAPERPMAPETWQQIGEAVDGCVLMVLDNLTQFVPTSLNDDEGVRLVYEQLSAIARRGIAVCVLAHTSDKRNEQGYSSDIPLGSTVIRTIPRWFVYMKRTADDLLRVELSGNAGRPWEMTLTGPSDRPRFDIIEKLDPDQLAERRRGNRQRREQRTLDQNAQIAEWVTAHPGVNQRDAAEQMSRELGFQVSQSRVSRTLRGLRGLPAAA
jgi:AAA domain